VTGQTSSLVGGVITPPYGQKNNKTKTKPVLEEMPAPVSSYFIRKRNYMKTGNEEKPGIVRGCPGVKPGQNGNGRGNTRNRCCVRSCGIAFGDDLKMYGRGKCLPFRGGAQSADWAEGCIRWSNTPQSKIKDFCQLLSRGAFYSAL